MIETEGGPANFAANRLLVSWKLTARPEPLVALRVGPSSDDRDFASVMIRREPCPEPIVVLSDEGSVGLIEQS